MRRLLATTIFLGILMTFLGRMNFEDPSQLMAESMIALGFILIIAYLTGKILSRWQLPLITGYILAGICAGPYLINLLSHSVVQNLQLIDNIALSLIALTAGGEFRYKKIKKQFRTIGSVIFWKIIFVVVGFILFMFIYRKNVPFLSGTDLSTVLGVGIILSALSIATSPATTIAVITETKAKGPFTDFILGVTVFKDIIVVLVFSLALSIAQPLIVAEASFNLAYVFDILKELILSIFMGIVSGSFILLYLKYIHTHTVLFLLGFIILGIEISTMLHLEVILLFMVAGFFVQNFSDKGTKLIEAIEEGSLPIYVIFFAIAGASLNFPIFLANWSLALLIVGMRMLTTFIGTYVGGKLTKATRNISHYGWMGFIGQAGLSLGLSVIVKQNLPGKIGTSIATLIVAAIVINQIIGPVIFRYSLVKVGEAKLSK